MHHLLTESISKITFLSKPTKTFLITIIETFSIVRGKANYTNLSRYSKISEKTIRRWFAKKMDFKSINSTILKHLPSSHTKIGVIDASFIKKAGKFTDGISWFWSGCAGKTMKGLEMSLVSIVDVVANTAYAIDCKQTIDQKGKTRTELYADHIESCFEKLREHRIFHIAADAFYTKKIFIDRIKDNGFDMIGKLRKDANLKWLYSGSKAKFGRPKKYDGKVEFNDFSKFILEEIKDGISIYSVEVYAVSMSRNIKLVLLYNNENDSYALLFSTDLKLTGQSIIKYYKARFQIEFFIRDAKQYTGLMDSQARSSQAINTHLNISATTLNALKIEDCFTKNSFSESTISIATWKCIKFNKHYISGILSMLEISKDDEKYDAVYREYSDYGAIAA